MSIVRRLDDALASALRLDLDGFTHYTLDLHVWLSCIMSGVGGREKFAGQKTKTLECIDDLECRGPVHWISGTYFSFKSTHQIDCTALPFGSWSESTCSDCACLGEANAGSFGIDRVSNGFAVDDPVV